MQVLEQVKVQEKTIDSDVAVVILLNSSKEFKLLKPYNLDVCGRTMHDWVKNAVGVCPCVSVEVGEEDNIVDVVKQNLVPSEYTVVLYADTPLLTRKSFLEIVDYVKAKKLNVCKLTRGFVFATSHIANADKVYSSQTHFFEEEDFLTAYNYKQLSMIREIQKSRIIDFWLASGVDIEEPSSVRIDADAEIGALVKICRNSSVLGKTAVGDGTLIGSNNIIENSTIGSGVTIENNCVIKNASVGDGSVLASSVVFCNFNGKKISEARVGSKVFIGSNVNLISPIIIEDNSYIAAGSTISEDVPEAHISIARPKQIIKKK